MSIIYKKNLFNYNRPVIFENTEEDMCEFVNPDGSTIDNKDVDHLDTGEIHAGVEGGSQTTDKHIKVTRQPGKQGGMVVREENEVSGLPTISASVNNSINTLVDSVNDTDLDNNTKLSILKYLYKKLNIKLDVE